MEYYERHKAENSSHPLEAPTSPSIVRVLAHLGLSEGAVLSKVSTKQLAVMLQDHQWERRASAATTLGKRGASIAVGPLVMALQDEYEEVRAAAARSLGQIGKSVPVFALVASLQDHRPLVREAAATALGRVGQPFTINPLIIALQDEYEEVRAAAAQALGHLGKQVPVSVLATALQDHSLLVREAAAEALGVLGNPSTRFLLLTHILKEDEVFVRNAIAQALMLLEPYVSHEFVSILLWEKEQSVQKTVRTTIDDLRDLGLNAHEEIAPTASLTDPLQSVDKSLQKAVMCYLIGRALDILNGKMPIRPLIDSLIREHQNRKKYHDIDNACRTFVQETLRERKALRLQTAGTNDRNEDSSSSEEVYIDDTLSSEELSTGETSTLHEEPPPETAASIVMNNTIWMTLYPALRSLACYLVRTSPLPYWHGQEDDMAEDIIQETVRRVIERAQKAERGEAAPIQSLKQMATTVVYNYCRDLKRRDYRLSRLDTNDAGTSTPHFYPADVHSDEYLLDTVVDKVDQNRLFDQLAGEIDHFPPKQKQALLVDLANRMSFDAEPTSLQESFLAVGIELRHYCQPLPDDQRERGRHISLCSQAYKRVANLGFAQLSC